MQDGGQLPVKEASKFMGVSWLAHEGQHETLDVGQKLWGENVIDVLLDDRDHLAHHPLDLLIQLLGINAWVLKDRAECEAGGKGWRGSGNAQVRSVCLFVCVCVRVRVCCVLFACACVCGGTEHDIQKVDF